MAEDVAAKRLTAAPLSEPTITRKIVLALPTNRPTPRAVQRVVDELRQCIKTASKRGEWPESKWLAEG